MRKAKKKSLKVKKESGMRADQQVHDLNEGSDADPVFKDDVADTTGLDTDAPDAPRTEIPAGNLFKEAAKQDKALRKAKERDVQIGLLIGGKNLVRLRAFGFDVVSAKKAVPASADMGDAG